MPLWLLKFLPVSLFKSIGKFIAKHWKPILAAIVFITYTLTVNNFAVDRTNTKWELKEADRVRIETEAKNKALSEAAELKRQQEARVKALEERLKAERLAAQERVAEARAEADRQRRLNSESTRKLEELQAADPNGPEPLADGVRDILTSGQDAVRSRRRP